MTQMKLSINRDRLTERESRLWLPEAAGVGDGAEALD